MRAPKTEGPHRLADLEQQRNSLDFNDTSVISPRDATPPIVSMVIANAVATFDADPGSSRGYLARAFAILRARAAHGPRSGNSADSRGGLARWQLNRIIDHVELHLAQRITGKDLAGLIGVSVGQLFRAFKTSVGIAPLHYVAARRIDLVCALMRTSSDSLAHIAHSAGFCDQAHLSRAFRRRMGSTPGAWRRENARVPGHSGTARRERPTASSSSRL
jgi:AraC family transcriptional regulator